MTPYLQGLEIPRAIAFVQRQLGWRLPLVPTHEIGGPAVCFPVMRAQVSGRRLNRHQLAEVSLIIRAIRSYYEEIGSKSDARRFDDVLFVVDAEGDLEARRHSKGSYVDCNAIANELEKQWRVEGRKGPLWPKIFG